VPPEWKIIGKKCDISVVVKLQVIFMMCLKNCAAVIVVNQLQNDRPIDLNACFVQNLIIADKKYN
jgi:hypothetical protein